MVKTKKKRVKSYKTVMNDREYHAGLRADLIALGICVHCRKESVVPGTRKCALCPNYYREHRRKDRENKPPGICRMYACKEKLAAPGAYRCAWHRAVCRANRARARAKKKSLLLLRSMVGR